MFVASERSDRHPLIKNLLPPLLGLQQQNGVSIEIRRPDMKVSKVEECIAIAPVSVVHFLSPLLRLLLQLKFICEKI